MNSFYPTITCKSDIFLLWRWPFVSARASSDWEIYIQPLVWWALKVRLGNDHFGDHPYFYGRRDGKASIQSVIKFLLSNVGMELSFEKFSSSIWCLSWRVIMGGIKYNIIYDHLKSILPSANVDWSSIIAWFASKSKLFLFFECDYILISSLYALIHFLQTILLIIIWMDFVLKRAGYFLGYLRYWLLNTLFISYSFSSLCTRS